MKRKRSPAKETPATTVPGAVRLGFSPSARAFFERLPQKQQDGLRRKLREFGLNPALGKPLTRKLRGYRRLTLGRLRSIAQAIVCVSDRVVLVLWIGSRKQGSRDDPYELAVRAIERGETDALEALELIVAQMMGGAAAANDADVPEE